MQQDGHAEAAFNASQLNRAEVLAGTEYIATGEEELDRDDHKGRTSTFGSPVIADSGIAQQRMGSKRWLPEEADVTSKDGGVGVGVGGALDESRKEQLMKGERHYKVFGSEVILGSSCHIHLLENGGISTLGHVHPRVVANEADGTMDLKIVEAAIRPSKDALFYPTTRLICIENTHANSGGRCITPEYTDEIGYLAKSYGSKLHVDGARIFNASIALGVPVERLVRAADSISICLSKGLGSPVGSVIVGSNSFIMKAKRLRKTLGGGMRQIGILCAAGLVSLRDMIGGLEYDHYNLRTLAESLGCIDGLHVDLGSIQTNIAFLDITTDLVLGAEDLCEAMESLGIRFLPVGKKRFRVLTHHQISKDDIQYAITCFKDYFSQEKFKRTA